MWLYRGPYGESPTFLFGVYNEFADFIYTLFMAFCIPSFFLGIGVAPWDRGENFKYGFAASFISFLVACGVLLIIYFRTTLLR